MVVHQIDDRLHFGGHISWLRFDISFLSILFCFWFVICSVPNVRFRHKYHTRIYVLLWKLVWKYIFGIQQTCPHFCKRRSHSCASVCESALCVMWFVFISLLFVLNFISLWFLLLSLITSISNEFNLNSVFIFFAG